MACLGFWRRLTEGWKRAALRTLTEAKADRERSQASHVQAQRKSGAKPRRPSARCSRFLRPLTAQIQPMQDASSTLPRS